VFGLTTLDSFDLARAVLVGLIPVTVIEVLKLRRAYSWCPPSG
jgi:hypothetical protein